MKRLNRGLRGWAEYFSLGTLSPAYQAVDRHVQHRLRKWLGRKHQKAGRGYDRFPNQYLYDTLGLVNLGRLRQAFRGRTA